MNLRVYISAHWRDAADQCSWALCDEAGTVVQTGQAAIAALPKADECIAIIASDRVLCLTVNMPAQSRRRWESALPFVAEEFTLTDPEDNHVVPGKVQKDGRRSIWVVDKQWLQSLILAFQKANLSLRLAVPEVLLSNLPAETWRVVQAGNRGFLRTGPVSGLALDFADEPHAPLALTLSLANSVQPKHIQFRAGVESSAVLPAWSDLPVSLLAGEQWDWRCEPVTPDAVNLLWGEFAPKTKWLAWLPKLRPLLFILLGLLLIQTIAVNLQWALLSRQRATLTHDMAMTFKKTFGEDSVLVNPPLQMQRNISALRHGTGLPDDADFLALLDLSAGALTPLPVGSIAGLHYESGRLDVDLKLAQASDLPAVQKRLQNSGLTVRRGEVHKVGQGVDVRLSIQVGGAV